MCVLLVCVLGHLEINLFIMHSILALWWISWNSRWNFSEIGANALTLIRKRNAPFFEVQRNCCLEHGNMLQHVGLIDMANRFSQLLLMKAKGRQSEWKRACKMRMWLRNVKCECECKMWMWNASTWKMVWLLKSPKSSAATFPVASHTFFLSLSPS